MFKHCADIVEQELKLLNCERQSSYQNTALTNFVWCHDSELEQHQTEIDSKNYFLLLFDCRNVCASCKFLKAVLTKVFNSRMIFQTYKLFFVLVWYNTSRRFKCFFEVIELQTRFQISDIKSNVIHTWRECRLLRSAKNWYRVKMISVVLRINFGVEFLMSFDRELT